MIFSYLPIDFPVSVSALLEDLFSLNPLYRHPEIEIINFQKLAAEFCNFESINSEQNEI